MRKLKCSILVALLACLGTSAAIPSASAAEPISFIVNADNPVTQITTQEISDYFLKKARHWGTGDNVRFIDRRENTPERTAFLKQVLKKSSRDLELYWIGEKLYTGASAPIQVEPDSAVATLVASFKGAIGYVSSEFKGAKGVKIIPVADAGSE